MVTQLIVLVSMKARSDKFWKSFSIKIDQENPSADFKITFSVSLLQLYLKEILTNGTLKMAFHQNGHAANCSGVNESPIRQMLNIILYQSRSRNSRFAATKVRRISRVCQDSTPEQEQATKTNTVSMHMLERTYVKS